MTIFIRLKGMPELTKTLQGAPKVVTEKTILRLSQVAYDEAQRGAARHSKTGALVQSLYNRLASSTSRAVGHDTDRAPHALFVNLGSKAHTIRPKNRKALRWVGPGGRFSFAKGVKHPGYRGDGYIILAADAAVRQFAAIVDAAIKEGP